VTDRDDEDNANTAVNKNLNDCAASQTDDQLGDSEDDVEPVNSTNETKRMKKKMRKDRRTSSTTVKGNRCPWTSTEKDAVFKFLSEYINKGIVPGKKACIEAIDKSGEILAQRS